jgi:transcription elongation factor SPT6
MIAVHEISRDPMLKKETRRFFKDYGVVSVTPTEKGISKIDEMHPFYVRRLFCPALFSR